MARIFQDSAGTIPVTTFDQPVGKIVRGAGTVDLVQSDPGKRPTMKLFAPDGAEPRWYLYCPAGTGLEAVVDAGEYEVASLDPWGGVIYETVTSDGSTPIAFTRSTMIMDILFRTPIFSEGEKVAIEQYWSKWKVTPTIDDLYMAGQRGVFLDLSDQSTLFTTTMQTPSANDDVAIVLDKSRGLQLGPELKGNFTIQDTGTPSIPTQYNPITGEGFVRRDDLSNGGFVRILPPAGGTYLIEYEVVSGSLAKKANGSADASWKFSGEPNVIGTRLRYIMKPELEQGGSWGIAAGNDKDCSFIIHSCREILTTPMYQEVGTARGQYKTDGAARVQLDKVDDNYEFDFTGSGGFEATWYQPSKEGLVKGKLLIPDGVWKLARNDPAYFPSNNIMGLIIVEGDVPEAMDQAIFDWWEAKGCGIDFGGTTSAQNWFRNRADIRELSLKHWDTSNVTIFSHFARDCSSLVTLDVRNWDTSSVTAFSYFADGCASLVALDVSNWDTSSVTNFNNFALGCSSLVALDVSNWDTSSVTNFNAFARGAGFSTLDLSSWDLSAVNENWGWFALNCSNLTTVTVAPGKAFSTITSGDLTSSIFQSTNLTQQSIDDILVNLESCSVDGGTFGQSGGSAPSAIGEAAIDALRLRNWTITVTGGY